MAIIGIDSSGIVGNPPIFFVASRVRCKHGEIDYNSQKHNIIHVNTILHDSFINRDQTWKLKLSAALIYYVMIELVHNDDRILMDTDFESNEDAVLRFIRHLLFTYYNETPIQRRPFDFVSSRENEHVKLADHKSKLARRGAIGPIKDVNTRLLNSFFDILMKIR